MRAIERRAYLRIEDFASVTWKIVSDLSSPIADVLQLPPTFRLLKELYKLELEAKELQREISESDRKLGSLVYNLNQRMSVLSSLAVPESSLAVPNTLDLSPAGVSFISPHLYAADTRMAIKLEFGGRTLAIASYARVRYCLLGGDDSYRVGAQFLTLDTDSETLIERYISSLQSEQRRRRNFSGPPI